MVSATVYCAEWLVLSILAVKLVGLDQHLHSMSCSCTTMYCCPSGVSIVSPAYLKYKTVSPSFTYIIRYVSQRLPATSETHDLLRCSDLDYAMSQHVTVISATWHRGHAARLKQPVAVHVLSTCPSQGSSTYCPERESVYILDLAAPRPTICMLT